MVIKHQKVELFFSFFMMNGADQHAAGLDAHHGSGRQICDCNTGLANQFFRLVICVNSAQNGPFCAAAVIQSEL